LASGDGRFPEERDRVFEILGEVLREPAEAVVVTFFLVPDVFAADGVTGFFLVVFLVVFFAGFFATTLADFLVVLARFSAVVTGLFVFVDRVPAEVALRPEVDRVFFLVTFFLAITHDPQHALRRD